MSVNIDIHRIQGGRTEHVDVMVIGGGQSGPATAPALPREGLSPVILKASGRTAGSWPHYYDSPDRYPHRAEVAAD